MAKGLKSFYYLVCFIKSQYFEIFRGGSSSMQETHHMADVLAFVTKTSVVGFHTTPTARCHGDQALNFGQFGPPSMVKFNV